MFIFRKQFLADSWNIELKLRDVCVFILKIYIQPWFNATNADSAPYQDLKLLKALSDYKSVNKSPLSSAVKKLIEHLWYLTPELAALSFFDTTLLIEEKRKMCSCKFRFH